MLCPTCQTEGRKFGKDRDGNQRFQCRPCRKTFSERPAKPLDEMRLPMDKAVMVLKLLTEGCSVRSTVRLSGVAKDTVLALLNVVGYKVAAMMEAKFAKLPVHDVQVDEIWGFVGMKEKTRQNLGRGEEYGSSGPANSDSSGVRPPPLGYDPHHVMLTGIRVNP